MKVAIVYSTRSGNTEQIAKAIAEVFERCADVVVMKAETAPVRTDSDLLIVGGPTEGHALTPPVKAFLDRLGQLSGAKVAAFDTRLKWPLWMSGSAARDIAVRLEQAGGRLLAPPESFIVTMEPKLREGELQRATRWAESLAATVAELQPAVALTPAPEEAPVGG